MMAASQHAAKASRMFAQQNLHKMPSERLYNLSADERSNALYDLHGVSESLDDNPELLLEKLNQMDLEIGLIPSKGAYRKAIDQKPEYVKSMRRRFLFAENLMPRQAAQRMIAHFETKRDLFGTENVGKKLDINDLTKNEKEIFQVGYLQLLSQRDRGGRAIVMIHGTTQLDYPMKGTIKMLFLMSLIMSDGEDLQKKGMVFICYGVGQERIAKIEHTRQLVASLASLPCRIVAIHACYDSPLLHADATMASYTMSSKYLCRYRCHFGGHLECQNNLLTFGIPRHVLPLAENGDLGITQHLEWLRSLEEDGISAASIHRPFFLAPGPADIIMGRGQRGVKCAGNQKLKRLLFEHKNDYDVAPRFQKSYVVDKVFTVMIESGSRFLYRSAGNFFVESDDDAIRSKIGHGFRNLRLPSSKKKMS